MYMFRSFLASFELVLKVNMKHGHSNTLLYVYNCAMTYQISMIKVIVIQIENII